MEVIAAIGLVGNIIQFVDFSGKLISESIQLYRSYDGVLAKNIDIETAAKHLGELNKRLKNSDTISGDGALQRLCLSCQEAANDLLVALDKVKVKKRQQKWECIRKALQSVWSKEEIKELEKRLEMFKEQLNLHIVVDLRQAILSPKR